MRALIERWARVLTALYPATFRNRGAVDLVRLLTDGARAARENGPLALAAYLLVNTVVCVRDALVEWTVAAWRVLVGVARGAGVTRVPSELARAFRTLRRQPRFAAIVALTLGVGIGAAGTVFALTNELLLRVPAGVADPNGAVFVMFGTAERPSQTVSGPAADEIRAGATLLDGIASYSTGAARMSIEGGRPVDVQAADIYGDYFELLGVRPSAGRLLSAEEIGPRADPGMAVVSERLASQLFGTAAAAVGRQIRMDDKSVTVVGVAGAGFRGTVRSWPEDVWLPISNNHDGFPADRYWTSDHHPLQFFIGRPRAGATTTAISEQIEEILGRIGPSDPDMAGFRVEVHEGLLDPFERQRLASTLRILGAGALLLLLVTCANVANLLLVRGVYRRPDVALARAIGASRWTIARERLAESVVLATAGTLAGTLFTWLMSSMFRGLVLFGQPEFEGLTLDPRVIGFAAAAVATTTLLFGVVPSFLSSRLNLTPMLREEGAQATSRWSLVRSGASVLQIALSLLLLIGTALLGRTVRNLYAVELGIDLEGVEALTIAIGRSGPRPGPQLDALHARILGTVTGVSSADLPSLHSWEGPYQGAPQQRINRVDLPDDQAFSARATWVTPNWFDLFRLPVLAGRAFEERDGPGAPFRVVLTAALATRLFGSTDVVGRSVKVGMRTYEEAEVIGVVGDVRLMMVDGPVDEGFFMNRIPTGYSNPVTLLYRAKGPSAATDVQIALENALPEIPVARPSPLSGRLDQRLTQQRLLAQVSGLFSTLATLLAAVGLFGVVSFAVAQRHREFGIRIALGADGARLRALVLRSAAGILLCGLAGGVAAALAMSKLVGTLLFGVAPSDPWSYVGAAALMAVVALAACWLPAREALATDPVSALKHE